MFTKKSHERVNQGRGTGNADSLEDWKGFCEGYNRPNAQSKASV